ncbi:MAG: hypothetical protein WB812_08330, partial [Woeseiaceae bacterium]
MVPTAQRPGGAVSCDDHKVEAEAIVRNAFIDDPTSLVPFRSSGRKAFNGLALAIVRGHPGPARHH